jgi:hypothetical protein
MKNGATNPLTIISFTRIIISIFLCLFCCLLRSYTHPSKQPWITAECISQLIAIQEVEVHHQLADHESCRFCATFYAHSMCALAIKIVNGNFWMTFKWPWSYHVTSVWVIQWASKLLERSLTSVILWVHRKFWKGHWTMIMWVHRKFWGSSLTSEFKCWWLLSTGYCAGTGDCVCVCVFVWTLVMFLKL